MRDRIAFSQIALGLLLAASAFAQSTGPVTVLADVRVIDGRGGQPFEHAAIVLRGDRIAEIVTGGKKAWPPNASIRNYSGKTVMPGLVTDHAHLGMVSGASTGPNNYTEANVMSELKQYESYGITTLTSLGLNGDLFYQLRPQLHAGTLPGADIFGADRGIGIPSGAPPINVPPDRLYHVSTPEEARAAVQESATRRPDLIKIWVDDFHGSLPVKMSPEIYQAVIEEAHKLGLRAAAHVYYLADAKELVRSGIDILAHGVRDQPVDAELIAAIKQHGVWYIPTLDLDESTYIYAQQPAWMQDAFFQHALSPELKAEFADPAWRQKTLADAKQVAVSQAALQMNERNLKTLVDAGVQIGFGTDSGATPLRIPGFSEHRELQLMVDAGLTPLQAIHIATENGARLLKLADRGVIAPGMLADLVILDGNPAADIKNTERIVAVFHRGKLVGSAVQ